MGYFETCMGCIMLCMMAMWGNAVKQCKKELVWRIKRCITTKNGFFTITKVENGGEL